MKANIEAWLREQFGDDAEIIGEIYDEYRQTLRRLLDDLSVALDSGDAAARDRVLHTIKGSAATVGDAEMSVLAQESRQLTDLARLYGVKQKMQGMMEVL